MGDALSVVTFDPGGTVGWSVFTVYERALEVQAEKILDNVVYWAADELVGTEDERVVAMLDLCACWDTAALVSEDFLVEAGIGGVGSTSDKLSPIRLNAAFAFGLRGRSLEYQLPELAMNMVDDAMLRSTGFWDPLAGKPHARDAVRHALTWLRRRKRANLLKAKAFRQR